MEEICHAPAVWLWDYLRRSGARGFLIPLSGGADSASVAAIVASMCDIVFKTINQGNIYVLNTLRKIVQIPDFQPKSF
jgi:NAD+ synthase (glutamine-hydrolysing)